MTTREFFEVKPVGETLAMLFAQLPSAVRTDTIATTAALGRVLAEAPRSAERLPSFVRSTVDGYAVRAVDTFGASGTLPAYLQMVGSVPMGAAPNVRVESGQAAEIFTGAMLPDGADAVVMVENTQHVTGDEIEVLQPVAPGENLVQVGEDVELGAAILLVGHTLRAQDIGGLLAVGILEVTVAARPRVAILGSGDELVTPDMTPGPGQIRDINAYTLAAMLTTMGAAPVIAGIAPDTLEGLLGLAERALAGADMLVLTAGSSVSTRDLTYDVVQRLGPPGVLQHGLAVKPGKPTIIAVCGGKPVIGLPGNPVSAFLVARQLLGPVVTHLLGATDRPVGMVQATLTANIASTTGREDSVPVRLFQDGGEWRAEPVFGKSNLIYTLVNANGLVVIPLNSNGLRAGSVVAVETF